MLRYHFRMTKRQWDSENFTEDEVIQMWMEFRWVKEQLGEVKKSPEQEFREKIEKQKQQG
jgi:hypothetical protein